MTIDSEPCPCGRTLRRMRSIDGRADDTLRLAGARGPVAVHPTQFAVVTADRDVREFQVVQEGGRLRLRLALRDGAAQGEAASRIGERVRARLAELGVTAPDVDVETCDGIERPASGKARVVVADRQPPEALPAPPACGRPPRPSCSGGSRRARRRLAQP